jgi:hypothetical protein
MILYKLKEMECELIFNHSQSTKKAKTVASIKDLLLQINHNAEVIPENSYTGLSKLLKKLKGASLSDDEKKLLKELIQH